MTPHTWDLVACHAQARFQLDSKMTLLSKLPSKKKAKAAKAHNFKRLAIAAIHEISAFSALPDGPFQLVLDCLDLIDVVNLCLIKSDKQSCGLHHSATVCGRHCRAICPSAAGHAWHI